MKRFKNILVGVDLSAGDCFVSDDLQPPTEEAINQALWLAKSNSAKLRFFYSLDISAQAQRLIQEDQSSSSTVIDHAEEILGTLVERARQEGVSADHRVTFGKSWVELIRQVIRDNHDLVIAGTRRLGSVKSFLLGSTGIKLLRKCPCTVWITQPQQDRRISSILVAHDLRPVGDRAMQLGCSMAQLHDAKLHVLHAAEYPEFSSTLPQRVSAEDVAAYRQNAEQHIASQLEEVDLAQPAEVHLVTDPPDVAIMQHVERHRVELLVLGTVARTGIPGLITGNTAERLLSQIPCSVLALKPEGFESPIRLD